MANLPKYSELPLFEGTNERHSWGVWGKDDQLGMINLLTPERVLRAASLVKKGKVFNVEPSRSIPHPEHASGVAYKHNMLIRRSGRTDTVDEWELHSGMGHLDGLRHIRFREFGYYNGRQDEDLDRDVSLGIENWAQHGLVGRGVLLDVARYMEKRVEPLVPNARFAMKPELLEAVAEAEKVKFESGDMMVLRTGWMRWYLTLSAEERAKMDGTVHNREGGLECPGLDNTQETAAWLWDRQFSFLLADNVALEAQKVQGADFQHRRILAMFGMGIGELLTFEELSDDCAKDGVYDFMVTLKPVNIPGAVGSPAHAYVIK